MQLSLKRNQSNQDAIYVKNCLIHRLLTSQRFPYFTTFAQSLYYFNSCQILIISSVQSWDTGIASQASLQTEYEALSNVQPAIFTEGMYVNERYLTTTSACNDNANGMLWSSS
jgi:hypothetical protein